MRYRAGMAVPKPKRYDDPNLVQIQLRVSEATRDRIDAMAGKLGHSRNSMATLLLTEAVKNDEWIINTISVPLRRLLDGWRSNPSAATEGSKA